jgi:hypothetical protein
MNELVEELLRLQIRQTEILGQILRTDAAGGNTSTVTAPLVVPPDNVDNAVDRPLRVGDQVRVLNLGRIRFRKDTIFTIVKIGNRVTSVSPDGLKIIRAAHYLERVA